MKTNYTFEKFGFNVCRVCFKTGECETLLSLFDEDGQKAEMLQLITSTNVLSDDEKYEALICGKCSRKLEQFFEFRRLTIYAENNYFRLMRGDQPSENEVEIVEYMKSSESSLEVSGKTEKNKLQNHVCENMSSLLKCWRCSLKNIVSMLPKKGRTEGSSSDLPEIVLNTLKAKGCPNLLNEPHLKLKAKIPVVILSRLKLPQMKIEPDQIKVEPDLQEPMEVPIKKKTPRITFKCQICKKILQSRTSFRYHLASVHFQVKRYFCDLCDGKFFYKSYLHLHMAKHLKNPDFKIVDVKKKFQCKKCPKSFSLQFRLNLHSQNVHSGVRPFKCWCKKDFPSKPYMKQHQMQVHGLCFK